MKPIKTSHASSASSVSPLRRGLLALPLAAAWPLPTLAQFRVEISGVGATQLPIAVAKFRDEDKAPQPIGAIVRADLERSGLFRPVDTAGVALDETSQPNKADWRGRSADALVAGSVSRLADGRFDIRYRLWDVVRGAVHHREEARIVAGYSIEQDNSRSHDPMAADRTGAAGGGLTPARCARPRPRA